MRRKILALLLSAVTAFGVMPGYVQAAENADYKLAVHYDMSHSGTQLLDKSGNGNHGILHNIEDSDFMDEGGDALLKFPGAAAGNDGPYVDLPVSIKNSLTDYKNGFSVEMALIPRTAQYQFLWTIGTGNQTDYLFFNPRLASNNINVAIKTQGSNNVENSIPGSNGVVLDTKNFSVMTVTSEGKTLKLYVNGEFKGTLEHNHNLDEVFAGKDNVLGYLAKSNWGADRYCDAIVTDFKIYDQTLSADQVKAIYSDSHYVYASALIEEDMEAVELGNITAVTENLKLPAEGTVNGSKITWSSDNPAVLGNDGKVTAADTTVEVKLTATFTLNGASESKVYNVRVIGKNDKADLVLGQYLNLPYYLTVADTLPVEAMGMKIKWESDSSDIDPATGKITPSKEGLTDVKLVASVSENGKEEKKEFRVKLLGTDSAHILSYIRQVDESKKGMYDEYVCDSMHLGYSKDGKTYKALLNNTGVLFAKAQGAASKLLKDPYVFRMKDGSFGILAVRINPGEAVADEKGTVLFFTSKDLVSYTEQGMIRLSDDEFISSPACVYDAVSDSYRITWTGTQSGLSYANTTKDFKTFTKAELSLPIQNTSVKTDIAYAIPGNTLGVTAEEAQYLLNKLDKVVNTGVVNPEITVNIGETKELADTKVTAEYSDGSQAEKTVIWNEDDLAKVDFNTEGTYKVSGTIRQISDQTKDNYPFLLGRADPNVVAYNGKYYFISTTEANSNTNIYVRESDTITGLNKAEEHLIYDVAKGKAYGYDTPYNHWAPELHVVNGELCVFFSANHGSDFNVQSMFMKLTGSDPKNYEDWGELHRFLNKDGGYLTEPYGGITLDMTHFVCKGKDYVVWAQRNFGKNGGTSDLWIGQIDPEKPYQLTSDAVKIVDCEYGWERNHTFVDEGPFAIVKEDKVYLTYSGGATDETYCVGMTVADLTGDVNLLDPNAWKKSNYPILTGFSVPGYNGPGHNSYVMDRDGTLINVFHARDDQGRFGRDAFLRMVHFGVDGDPILDMTEEREILPENKNVTMTVQVKKEDTPVDPDPPVEKLPYVDVTEDDWFYDGVYYNFVQKTMTGKDKEHFAPYENLARAQFAIIVHRLQGEPKVAYEPTFPDVADEIWYTDAILWAAKEEIVTGYTSTGYFGPADNILREQMAVMMYRYANSLDYDTSKKADFSQFEDASLVDGYAEDAMKWAVGNGIIKGKDNETRVDPLGNASRAECAIIIQRFMETYAK